MESLAILVKNLSYAFQDKELLNNVNLEIYKNTIYGFVGKNGAGKTTLMHLITNQLIAKEGQIEILGKDPRKTPDILEHVCIVGEDVLEAPYMKVRDIFGLYQQFYEAYDVHLQEKLVSFFKLPTHQTLRQYSRGMKSLVSSIIGICSKAEITLLDEPTLGMDAQNREDFYKILLETYIDHPRTFIISTHWIDEVEHLIERLIILDEGKIKMDCSVEEIKNKAYYLMGTEKAFELIEKVENKKFKKTVGSKQIYTYWGTLDDAFREKLMQAGIEADRMSLQEFFLEQIGERMQENEGFKEDRRTY